MLDIVESSPQRLLIRTSVRSIAVGLSLALVGLLVTLLMAYETVRSVSVQCQRVQGPEYACEVTERLAGIFPIERRRLARVSRAVVAAVGDSSDPSYVVRLTGPSAELSLSRVGSGPLHDAALVREFNELVDRGAPSIDVVQLPGWASLLSLVPLFFGLVALALAQPYAIEVDVVRSLLTIRTLFSVQFRGRLSEIRGIETEVSEQDGEPIQKVFLRTATGAAVQLAMDARLAEVLGDYLTAQGSAQDGLGPAG